MSTKILTVNKTYPGQDIILPSLIVVLFFSLLISACSSGDNSSNEDPATNELPVSNAGPDQVVDKGEMVQLDGSGSTDPDMDTLSYQWTQTSGPAVSLLNATTATPSFLAHNRMSTNQALSFSLIVNDGSGDSSDDEVTITIQAAPAIANGLRTTVTSVLSKGRFTFNNPWTQADLDSVNISATIDYEATGFGPYTITVAEYEERKRKCYEDYNVLHPALNNYDAPGFPQREYTIQDRKCYPRLEWVYYNDPTAVPDPVATQVLQRYGYYCGGGYGGGTGVSGYQPPIFNIIKPEPLDGLDYCCRLHDAQTWGGQGDYSNECGMAMCVSQVTMFGLSALPADVEEARQYWFGGGAQGGAAILCPGNQRFDAPAPTLE